MQLVSYAADGGVSWGIVVDQGGSLRVIDGTSATHGRIGSIRQLLKLGALGSLPSLLSHKTAQPLEELQLLPPIPDPGKILAVGFNYAEHAQEANSAAAAAPAFFARFTDNLVGHGQPIVRPVVSECLDFEGELAVIIGRAGRHVSKEDAMAMVAGYACFNDGSVRDFQKESITAGKNFPATAPFGPWLVTADAVPHPGRLVLETRLNGVRVQRSETSHMVHDIASLIAYASRFTPLRPGDVLATGTPAGVGLRRFPPLWMRAGDVVEVEIEGIGLLRNPVIDEGPDPSSSAAPISS
ncbi:fumarylacetoacetate hydrolase family protein [Ottowia sp. VDI28]|uniref:fumarylacetoacetate hydrolase family protein n=1 Tax=Ottowia sp. VDI28 TaxID=3133968 RepID=UPI003C2CC3B1